MAAPRTSIIIPVHNQLGYTQACLQALDVNTPSGDWEVIVVDNGSTDGTSTWLSTCQLAGGPVRVVSNSDNEGFAFACNQGMAIARGEGLLLLNNDTIVPPGWLERLWAPLAANPAIGMTGPMSNSVAGDQLISDVPYGQDTAAMAAFAQERSERFHGKGKWLSSLSGFCLLIHRRVVERLGGFDDRYGLGYFEDNDYCLRARLADFNLWMCADAFVHHYGQQTSSALPEGKRIHIEMQWAIFLTKWQLPPRPFSEGYTVAEVRERFHGQVSLFQALPSPQERPNNLSAQA